MYLSIQNQEATKESVTVAINPPPVGSSTTAAWEQDQAITLSSYNPMYSVVGSGHIQYRDVNNDVITTT